AFLGVPESPEAAAPRLVETWIAAVERELLEPSPLMAAAGAWLRRNVPHRADCIALCQGQVGPGQILYDGERVAGSTDWESAFLGDPMADIAYFDFSVRPLL